jgi:hypothetical protein
MFYAIRMVPRHRPIEPLCRCNLADCEARRNREIFKTVTFGKASRTAAFRWRHIRHHDLVHLYLQFFAG